jgi:hypothetical protein
LKSEDGDSILQEFTILNEASEGAASINNNFFQFEADSVLDFSETNPFSEVDRF